MSNVMTFKYLDGEMVLSDKVGSKINNTHKPINRKVNIFNNNKIYSISPLFPAAVLTGASASGVIVDGIFWDAFMKYIFPYMLDIAKVFCAIKIAQAFYQERRGGREGGTGIEAIVTYGKFYLLFALLPWAVELLDELGTKMLSDLRE